MNMKEAYLKVLGLDQKPLEEKKLSRPSWVPESIGDDQVSDFMGALATAHKEGCDTFKFGEKSYKMTVNKPTNEAKEVDYDEPKDDEEDDEDDDDIVVKGKGKKEVDEKKSCASEGYIVKYHAADGEHKNSSKVFTDKAKADKHAALGNSINKVGGKYTVHKIDDEGREVKEELKGDQHKIDKNKNGKIDAHDFKLLRKEDLDEDVSVLDEGQAEDWKRIQAMDKGSITGGKEEATKRLGYLNAVYAYRKKYGQDTLKVKKEIEAMNKSHVNEETDDEHYARQSPKMQTAINLHLRKGKSYSQAVAAAKVHVKEDAKYAELTATLSEGGFTEEEILSVISKLEEKAEPQEMGDNLSDGELDFIDTHEVEIVDGTPVKPDFDKDVDQATAPTANGAGTVEVDGAKAAEQDAENPVKTKASVPAGKGAGDVEIDGAKAAEETAKKAK